LKAIKSINDRDNIRRFLYITNAKEELSKEPLNGEKNFLQKGRQFMEEFDKIGRASILGEKARSMRTEKGRVFLKIQETLARARNLFSPPAPVVSPSSPSMSKEEEKQESRYREGLNEVSAGFKQALERLDPEENEAYVYRLAIQALDAKPFDQEAVSRSYAEISLYIKGNSVSSTVRDNISEEMEPYIDKKIVEQFKRDVKVESEEYEEYKPKSP